MAHSWRPRYVMAGFRFSTVSYEFYTFYFRALSEYSDYYVRSSCVYKHTTIVSKKCYDKTYSSHVCKIVVQFWNKGFKFFKHWEQPLLLCFVQSTISTEVTAQTLANRSAPLNELFCLGSPEQSPIASLLAYKTPVITIILCALDISVPFSHLKISSWKMMLRKWRVEFCRHPAAVFVCVHVYA